MLRKWWNYLVGKSPELLDMGSKDVVLGKVVADVHRKRTGSSQQFIPLRLVEPIHALDREGPMEKLRERIEAVRAAADELRAKKRLARADLDAVLPSVSGFKGIPVGDGSVIVFEGNGRLAALHAVLAEDDPSAGGVEIEVEVYEFRNRKKMLRRARRVQKMNCVGPYDASRANSP